MEGKKFIAKYVPLTIAFVFMGAITSVFGVGAPQGSPVPQGPFGLIKTFIGAVLGFATVTFGFGAIIWSVGYAFLSETPSYLRMVLRVAVVVVLLILFAFLINVFSPY